MEITTSQKQRIFTLKVGYGGRGGRVGGGRGGDGGGNHYQGKRTYKGGRGGRVGCGVRGSSDKRVRFNNQRNPPQRIDWV